MESLRFAAALVLVAGVLAVEAVMAQTPATTAAGEGGATAAEAPAPAASYTYVPAGRRDPFVSLVRRGSREAMQPAGPAGSRPDGVRGLTVEEVVVRGVIENHEGWVAMVAAPNGRTYTVRPGDRLLDGTVRAITAQAVVFLQDVRDPMSVDKPREVRKVLRGGGVR